MPSKLINKLCFINCELRIANCELRIVLTIPHNPLKNVLLLLILKQLITYWGDEDDTANHSLGHSKSP
jgi:hypothetical protein